MIAETLGLKRDILNGMAHYRIDPTSITLKDTTEGARGGQGVVVIGTLPPRESYRGMEREAVEKLLFERNRERISEALKENLPEELKELPDELRKLFSEAAGKAIREREVAVKQLYWPRDDTEQSTRFFKYFANELRLMACLSHPNIIEFLGFVEDAEKGDAWIILPWEANGNVRDFLKSGEWDIPERASLVRIIGNGIEELS
ncbi:hypothetical protein FRC00_008402 [Tulasnella sp. 408]|nr:hypothetical protein FRC00_008402 [Tulasnella sp. 408]